MRESAPLNAIRKVLRYVRIYGPGPVLFKVAGRSRVRLPLRWWRRRSSRSEIGLVGCGQFGFATIAYHLGRAAGHCIGACFDIDAHARESLGTALGVPRRCASIDALLETPGLRLVYVASNHASHAPYAVQALLRGLDVYVEKPIAVDLGQLASLLAAQRISGRSLYAGYNRPFSRAIRELRSVLPIDPKQGFSMQCFIAGHQLGPQHWYRRPGEGTRVCGNLGHWLDLFIHVLAWRGLPERLRIVIASADPSEPDDNFAVTIASERQDIFSVMLTSRNEPFEGIYESICLQHGEATCHIEDFRRMTVRLGPRVIRRRYWPKDVGHRAAILQPFHKTGGRDWHEVELSTLLMLRVADMVRNGEAVSEFALSKAWQDLNAEVERLVSQSRQ